MRVFLLLRVFYVYNDVKIFNWKFLEEKIKEKKMKKFDWCGILDYLMKKVGYVVNKLDYIRYWLYNRL